MICTFYICLHVLGWEGGRGSTLETQMGTYTFLKHNVKTFFKCILAIEQ